MDIYAMHGMRGMNARSGQKGRLQLRFTCIPVEVVGFAHFAEAGCGGFGGKVALAPRLFLRELVDIMDRVDIHEEYDPQAHYKLELDDTKPGSNSEGDADSGQYTDRYVY